MSKESSLVTIYVDGFYKENRGGWGAVLKYGETVKEISGNIIESSKPRTEMVAIIEAFKHLKRPCQVDLYSNSQHLMNSLGLKWKRRVNLDLWDELDRVVINHQLKCNWIKGYIEESHKQAHELAKQASKYVSPHLELFERETNVAEARKDLQILLKQLSKSEIIRDGEAITVTLQTDDHLFEFHSRKTAPMSSTES
jgi:ribonuclease HI